MMNHGMDTSDSPVIRSGSRYQHRPALCKARHATASKVACSAIKQLTHHAYPLRLSKGEREEVDTCPMSRLSMS